MAEIESLPDPQTWAEVIAGRLTDTLRDEMGEIGRAVFAGPGGSTPTPIYRSMAQADLDWSRVTVTLVDERDVPDSSADSNAALLKRELMSGSASVARLVPLRHEAVTLDRAALIASRALAAEAVRLDAVLLGMGEDGHICSMFPASPTLKSLLQPELKPQILGVPEGRDGAAPVQARLSMNLPWLMTARRVVLALTGRTKRAVFEREAAGDPRVQPIAALVASVGALEVVWTEGRT